MNGKIVVNFYPSINMMSGTLHVTVNYSDGSYAPMTVVTFRFLYPNLASKLNGALSEMNTIEIIKVEEEE